MKTETDLSVVLRSHEEHVQGQDRLRSWDKGKVKMWISFCGKGKGGHMSNGWVTELRPATHQKGMELAWHPVLGPPNALAGKLPLLSPHTHPPLWHWASGRVSREYFWPNSLKSAGHLVAIPALI